MSKIRVINARTLAEKKVNERQVKLVNMFTGSAKENLSSHDAKSIGRIELIPAQAVYNGSAGEAKVMADIEQLQKLIKANGEGYKLKKEDTKKLNAAQYPGQTAIEALIGAMYLDITRRDEDGGDLTSMFATEINDPDSDQTVNVNYFYRYVAVMGEISGTNDGVNLIQQKLGGTDSFVQTIKAVGWKDTLENLLFNKVHTIAKVNQAAADADVDARNAAIIGQIVATTFDSAQKQAADTTSDATYDVLMYNTIRKAVKKLVALEDPQTNRKIVTNEMYLLCNSANRWDLERVLSGQLTIGGATGSLSTMNLQSLPISTIVEYDRGIMDGYTYGKEEVSFPGVTEGIAYLYVPYESLFVMNKRGLTLETGQGSVLQASTEERMWYRVNGVWIKDFLGGSYSGGTSGKGYIVEITLPTDA
jgi:hypothetical protein